jgi:hypothetical protein
VENGLKLNLLTFDLGDRKYLNIYLQMYAVKTMGQCRFVAVTGMDLKKHFEIYQQRSSARLVPEIFRLWVSCIILHRCK